MNPLTDIVKEIKNLESTLNTKKEIKKVYNTQIDKNRINTARDEFTKKDFKKSIAIYKTIKNKSLLNDLDNKIIEYCDRNINS